MVSERFKFNNLQQKSVKTYFWRTTQQQEIDYIEEFNPELLAVEFKWNPLKKSHFPKTFTSAYPSSKTMLISPENKSTFLTI